MISYHVPDATIFVWPCILELVSSKYENGQISFHVCLHLSADNREGAIKQLRSNVFNKHI